MTSDAWLLSINPLLFVNTILNTAFIIHAIYGLLKSKANVCRAYSGINSINSTRWISHRAQTSTLTQGGEHHCDNEHG
jgi:hypothetical protein